MRPTLAVFRKKALLVLLAQREAERLGVSVDKDDIQAVIQSVRAQNNLFSEKSLDQWRVEVGFDIPRFHAFMRECAVVAKLEGLFNDEIAPWVDELMRIDRVREAANEDFPSMPPVPSNEWVQVNLSLGRQGGSFIPAALALFDYLREQVPVWRREGFVTRFFFLRKPPGVRLRFLCPNGESILTGELAAGLKELQRRGLVQDVFRSPYEPEQARFGGAAAMALVHDYFDADTSQWLLLQRIDAEKRRSFFATTLLTSVLNHLFSAVVEDPAEVWDIWCQCAGLSGEEAGHKDGDCLDLNFASIEGLRPLASQDETAILDAYEAANVALAGGLKKLWSEGKLQRGVRGVLATTAMFMLNRHGIDENTQSQLVNLIRRGFAAPVAAAGSK